MNTENISLPKMPLVRLIGFALVSLAAAALLVSALCGWMFYIFYLKWIRLFENGRYFDPVTEMVYTESGMVWGVFSLASLLLATALYFLSRKIRNTTLK